MADKVFKLVSPEGDKYETSNATEAVRLKAHGYRAQKAEKAEPKPKSPDKS